MTRTTSTDELAINTIRTLSMDAVQAANSGHPGTPMALAPLGYVIFKSLRRHDPAHPEWPDRDRFVLSAGHASMLQYSLLHLSGYEVSLDDLKAFRQWGSRTPGHPEVHETPGIETTTGPLGQGVANAVGMAMAERHLAARFNRPGHQLLDHRTWAIASDGDLMEGVAAEAASLAGHLGLGRLTVFWDDNRITIDGGTELAFTEDVVKRFAAYGWHTTSVEDANDLLALEAAAREAMADPRPSFVRVRTIIGWPSPNKQGTSSAHGSPLGKEEITKTKAVLGWPDTPFFVPDQVRAVTEEIRGRGQELWQEWESRLADYKGAFPELARELEDAMAGRLPGGWDKSLPEFPVDKKGMASRVSGGAVLEALAKKVTGLIGGSADLASSNNTFQKGEASFNERTGVPRNVHFGVREHAMGSIANGMALHGGVVPYTATFFVFSDYMKPAIRLASLMKLPVRYVFTHDSIGLGEDGPTHQPVEHLAALRVIPGMTVLRPCDANEARESWKAAMQRRGPAALVLSRQNLPTLDRTKCAPADGVARGAYVLTEAQGEPRVLLIATGSEVHVALSAQELLESQGVPTRVVSMPSWELFSEQTKAWQDSVLPPAVTARVAIEAASSFGWERWIGSQGTTVTLDHFGASAPAPRLFEEFGFTAENVARKARDLLA